MLQHEFIPVATVLAWSRPWLNAGQELLFLFISFILKLRGGESLFGEKRAASGLIGMERCRKAKRHAVGLENLI